MLKEYYALSLKQPWAALLVHGVKTIEVRSWSTRRRGLILIHASQGIDERPTGWEAVTPEILPTTQLCGGIIGCARLTDCRTYADSASFTIDSSSHHNDPGWFEKSPLYGFVFADARRLPLIEATGWFRFFRVELEESKVER